MPPSPCLRRLNLLVTERLPRASASSTSVGEPRCFLNHSPSTNTHPPHALLPRSSTETPPVSPSFACRYTCTPAVSFVINCKGMASYLKRPCSRTLSPPAHWPRGLVPSLGRARRGFDTEARQSRPFLPFIPPCHLGPTGHRPWLPRGFHPRSRGRQRGPLARASVALCCCCGADPVSARRSFTEVPAAQVSVTTKSLAIKINYRFTPKLQTLITWAYKFQIQHF